LKLLRRLPQGALVIKDAETFVPNCINRYHSAPNHNLLLGNLAAEIESDITQLVEGDTPVELVFEMYNALVRYCQGFEQLPAFKADMASRQRCMSMWEVIDSRLHRAWGSGLRYRERELHPVEYYLRAANQTVEIDNVPLFKQTRADILLFLERQYQRISGASINIVQFVNE
jgi:hypothetical protein